MASIRAIYQKPLSTLDSLGEELAFYVKALAWTPRTVRRYKKEILRILAEVTLGSGALAVIGGTVGVITAMCFFTGTEVVKRLRGRFVERLEPSHGRQPVFGGTSWK